MRILVADDGAVERLLLQQTLEGLGHTCLLAEDGARAWDLFQRQGADVILSDWMMPGLDGPELCRRVRQRGPDGPTVYFVLLTSLDDRAHMLEGLSAGADDYVTKPFSVEDVRARLIVAARVTALHRALAVRDARRDALLRIGRRLAAEAQPERVLRGLLEEAVALLDGDDGGVAQWSPARGELVQVQRYRSLGEARQVIPLGHGASGLAAQTRLPRIVNESQDADGASPPDGTAEARAVVAVPLVHEARLLGTLSVSTFDRERRFTRDDADVLELLAGTAAATLVGLERAALQHENVRLSDEVRQAMRTREDFLSAAAHDIKNPVAAIKMHARLLRRRVEREQAVPAAEVAEELHDVETTATRLEALVEELLDLTRLEMDQPLALARQPLDLVALARQTAAVYQRGADKHHIRMEPRVAALEGTWDAARLERVLGNLLSNALKYSPDGGQVTVTLDREDGQPAWAVLAVRDAGIGIPAADLPRIFERFWRARNVVGTWRGTGIGLASVRQIVEEHGGTVAVESREGHGSTFTVRLPLGT